MESGNRDSGCRWVGERGLGDVCPANIEETARVRENQMEIHNETHVEDAMATPVETISASATLRTAAKRMRDEEINSLLVPGSETGIVTSTDVMDAVAEGYDPEECHVADLMTTPVESVSANLRLAEAAAMMTTYGVNHLPVRDASGDYVGMVSSTDIRDTVGES